jgi:hypothetical protein
MAFKWSLLGLVLLTGCGTSATITRANAPAIDGKIIGGDSSDVYIETRSGVSDTVPRSEITDIDHPGNVAATIGALVTAYGGANIAVGLPQCDKQGSAYCAGVFMPIGIGLPVMIWGIATYAGSVSALGNSPSRERQGSLFVLPTHEFAGQPKTPGVSVGASF